MQFFHKNKSQASLVGSADNRPHSNNNSFQQHQQPQQHQYQHQDQHLHRPPSSSPHSPIYAPGDSLGNARDHHRYSYVHPDHYDYGYTHPAHAYSQGQLLNESDNPTAGAVPILSDPSQQEYSRHPTLNLVPNPATGLDSPAPSANPNVSSSDLSWNQQSPETSPQVEPQPRKSRRSIFGFHTSSSKESASTASKSKVLGRNLSVRKKGQAQAAPPKKGQAGHPIEPTLETAEEHPTDSHMPLQSKRAPQYQQQQTPYPSKASNRSSSNIESQPFDGRSENRPVHRVNTDPISSQESFYQPRQSSDSYQPSQYPEVQHPTPRNPQFQISYPPRRDSTTGHHPSGSYSSTEPPPYSPQVDPHHTIRPPSQQSLGPPSPLHQYQAPDQNQQKPVFGQTLQPSDGSNPSPDMTTDRQTGLRQPVDTMPQHAQGREATGGNGQSQYPPNMPQGGSFKGNHSQQSLGDQERETPRPPPKGRDESSEAEYRVLAQKHDELQTKYNKVKRHYFEKDAQVQALQNTVAHQRMSTSRTVLDDSEYATRFGRLDGAINNLAFNIRKDWKSIPVWLQGVVNEDAVVVGTKEMTAVGRACLTRWLVDEVFDRYFHPSLEPNLSRQLKLIERNVRRGGKIATEEDRENHISRISTWRRTTLDGLSEALQGRAADEYRAQVTKGLVEKLTASLEMHLKTPPPPGLENSVSMILELAIFICANIPLESREISIEYFLPGAPIAEAYMKVETALPPLINPIADTIAPSEPQSATDRLEQGSTKSGEPGLQTEGSISEQDRDNGKDSSSSSTTHSSPLPLIQPKEPKKKSVFGSLISKKPHPSEVARTQHSQPDPSRPGSAMLREREGRDDGEYRGEADGNGASSNANSNNNSNRIRLAAFVSVEVRSKGAGNVISRAPVYGLM
ncbi:hypothetical protein FQN52_003914 [Onygenales sp. PD_12]|nr:hypothetical protein FQN52_003914 [Onygenales sp. PD_12]